jgi:RNA polymerase sigma factor (TIGR02999 family)
MRPTRAFDREEDAAMDEAQRDLTRQLNALLGAGEVDLDTLYRLVARDLGRIAAGYLDRERPGHTLQPADLVTDALLRLLQCSDQRPAAFASRRHFFCTVAQTMRRLLVDHARRRNAKVRGGDRQRDHSQPLEEVATPASTLGVDLFALDRALDRLGELDATQAQIFDLYYFGQLTREQVAAELGLTLSRVKDELAAGKAWLLGEVRRLQADDAFQAEVRRAEDEALRGDSAEGGA